MFHPWRPAARIFLKSKWSRRVKRPFGIFEIQEAGGHDRDSSFAATGEM